MTSELREGAACCLKGEPGRIWRIVYIGINLGGHYQEAHLLPAGESWGKPLRMEKLADLSPVPVDLEDWPCSPA